MKNDQYQSDIQDEPYNTPPPKNKIQTHNSSSISTDNRIFCFICQKVALDFNYCECQTVKICVVCVKNKTTTYKKNALKKKNHICKINKNKMCPKGLINNGNTCYINSTIQCLRNLRAVSQYFSLQNKINEKIKFKFQMQKQQNKFLLLLGKVDLLLKQQQQLTTEINVVISNIKYLFSRLGSNYFGNFQQDASEFLQKLLQQLQLQFQQSKKINSGVKSIDKDDSISTNQSSLFSTQLKNMKFVTEYLKGELESETKCQQCMKNIKNKDTFYILTLNFPVQINSTFYIKTFIYQFDKRDISLYYTFSVNNPTKKDLQNGINQLNQTFFYLASFEEGVIQITDQNINQNLKFFKDKMYNSHENKSLQLFGVKFKQNNSFNSFLTVKFVCFKGGQFKSVSFKRPFFYHNNTNFNKYQILNQFKKVFLSNDFLKLEQEWLKKNSKSTFVFGIFDVIDVYFVTWPNYQRNMKKLSKFDDINQLTEPLRLRSKEFQIWIDCAQHKQINQFRLNCFRREYPNQKKEITPYPENKQFCLQINTMINSFTNSQKIHDYRCEQCNSYQITKKYQFLNFGECLIIRLGRFNTSNPSHVTKINDKVKFEFTLRLYSKEGRQQTFDLCGVIIHIGDLHNGHYYSIIKKDHTWYKMNDSTVTEYDFQRNKKELYEGAYLLFYDRAVRVKKNVNNLLFI